MKSKRDFLTVFDLSGKEIARILNRATELKGGADAQLCPLIGKSIGLFFEKASTRTRVSFEVGIYQLGGQSLYLNPREIQLGRGETVSDTARVLSRYLDAIIIRTYSHGVLEEFASYATVPVINGLSDLHHPCQALADLLTIQEHKKRFKDLKIAYIGDGNNVANSLVEAASRTGMHMVIACPRGYEPDPDILASAMASAKNTIAIETSPHDAAVRADVLYTDVWVSMGQEKEAERKKQKFMEYQINSHLLSFARKNAIVLHCMPVHRGEEITDEVMESRQSRVFDQAENRLHTQKALMEFLLA